MNLARKMTLIGNLEDIISRLFLQSSPIVRNLTPKTRASPPKTAAKNIDDMLVETFFDN